MKNQFAKTKEMFANATSTFAYPLTYETWMSIPKDYKCAALFVNFYYQIVLAWQKQKTYFLEDEDAVSVIIQYLLKNVEKIEADASRFKAAYIFTVSCNAIIGFTRPMNRQEYYDYYQSEYFDDNNGEEKSIFDTIADDPDSIDKEHFNTIIASLDDTEFGLAMQIISGKPLSGRQMKKFADAYARLRELFYEFHDDVNPHITKVTRFHIAG